jgi:hypothetical protein
LGNLLGLLPAYPGSLLFVTGLNVALAKQLANDVTELAERQETAPARHGYAMGVRLCLEEWIVLSPVRTSLRPT